MWIKEFRKGIEKLAFPVGGAINAALTLSQIKDTAKENLQKAKLTPARDTVESLQLPGSNSFQFEGSKRIDSVAESAKDLY